jgi:hypothetical protein
MQIRTNINNNITRRGKKESKGHEISAWRLIAAYKDVSTYIFAAYRNSCRGCAIQILHLLSWVMLDVTNFISKLRNRIEKPFLEKSALDKIVFCILNSKNVILAYNVDIVGDWCLHSKLHLMHILLFNFMLSKALTAWD